MSFKHNKKRNGALVYEFLIRKLSEAAIEENKKDYEKSLSLLRKYYSSGQLLTEEKQIFDVILGTNGVSRGVARGIVDEVVSAARQLDHKRVDIKKSNLIKEINHSFGKNFFSDYKLDDYRVYASVQLLINGCSPKKTIVESAQRVQLEEALVEYMTKPVITEETSSENDDLVYVLAMKKFNEKYQSSLNEAQRTVLRSYVEASMSSTQENKDKLVDVLKEEKKRVIGIIDGSFMTKEIAEDEKMRERLVEAKKTLSSMGVSTSAAGVEEMMLFSKLAEEISS